MDIQFYGANCLRITSKQASIVIDDALQSLGKKSITKKNDIALITNPSLFEDSADTARIKIDVPGEYEISTVSFKGIPARAHMDEDGKLTATMYKIVINDIRILVTGHVHPELSEEQFEKIGSVDVLIIPVGGNGYTLDPVGAAKLIKALEPKITIPTHYDIKGLNYEVPQQTLEEALKVLPMDPAETLDKYKLKPGAALPEVKQLIVLEPQV